MKQKLFLFVLFGMVVANSFGQTKPNNNALDKKENADLPLYNLYYLSKYITAENLNSEQANLIYNALVQNIGIDNSTTLSEKFKEAKEPSKLKTRSIGSFLNNREVKKNQIQNEIMDYLSKGEFDLLNSKIGNTSVKAIQELKLLYNENISNELINDLSKKNTILDSLKQGFETNDAVIIEKFNTNWSTLKSGNKTLSDVNEVYEEIEKNKAAIKIYENKQNTYLEKAAAFAKDFVKSKNVVYEYNIDFKKSNDIKATTSEININATVLNAEQRAATSSYNIPSESDMINAMAMFLAKRAKQETAIWFMDKIRGNIKNPLVYEAFPETIKLIESLENFKTPNFSIAWRYAIATDFVKMPKNLAHSAWVKSFIFDSNEEKAENFTTAVEFGYDLNRLITEKYNYRDIIRYFYTNPHYDYLKTNEKTDKQQNMKELLKNSISILYILTNEFFAVDEIDGKKNYRLLSYEEVNSLSNEQWLALGQLIQLKYPNSSANFNDFFNKIFVDSQKKEGLSKWLGNLLISLSQFDKVNSDFQKVLESKADNANFHFYNVWQNSIQIIDNLDYKKYTATSLNSLEDQVKTFNIEILKQSTTVYEQIQNKNFSAAVQNILALIQKIADQKNVKVSTNFKVKDIAIEVTKESVLFNESKKSYKLIPIYKNKKIDGFQIYYNKQLVQEIQCHDFYKIQPFLRFVRSTKNDDNFKIIKSLDSAFVENIAKISDSLKFDVIPLINFMSLYADQGLDQQKLLTFIHTAGSSIFKNTAEKTTIEQIKQKYQDQLLKLTSFFGDVLVAKNAEELADVIDSHALPPTSYKLKRRVARSLDLNGYVGLQGSRILTNGFSSVENQYTIGITAPIGFAYTWSTLKNAKPNNWGFTIDIVDLGNIVNHYLVSTKDNNTKDIHFSEVFSPAFSLMYAIRNSPFVIFSSAKLLPLKTTTIQDPNTNATIKVDSKAFDATVISFGLKIDIPLINLWSKTSLN